MAIRNELRPFSGPDSYALLYLFFLQEFGQRIAAAAGDPRSTAFLLLFMQRRAFWALVLTTAAMTICLLFSYSSMHNSVDTASVFRLLSRVEIRDLKFFNLEIA